MSNINNTEIMDSGVSDSEHKKNLREKLKKKKIYKEREEKENNKDCKKKPIPFIISFISYVLIGFLIFGIIKSPTLKVDKFYNSNEFKNILLYEVAQSINNIVYYGVDNEHLLDKNNEYNKKVDELNKIYEEKEKNLSYDFQIQLEEVIAGKNIDLLNKILSYCGISYDTWKTLDETEKRLYISDFKKGYHFEEEKDNLKKMKDLETEKFKEEILGYETSEALSRYENAKSLLNRYINFKYYIVDNKNNKVITNMQGINDKVYIERELKENSEAYIIIKDDNSESNIDKKIINELHFDYNLFKEKDTDIYIQIPKNMQPGDDIYDIKEKYEGDSNNLFVKISLILGSIGTLIYLIYLIVNRKRYFIEGHLNKLYKILYTEVKIIGSVLLVSLSFILFVDFILFNSHYFYSHYLKCFFISIIFSLCLFITLNLNIKYIRNCNNVFKDLINRSLIIKIIVKLYRYFNSKKTSVKDAISLLYFEGKKSYKIWIILSISSFILIGGIIVTIISFNDPYSASVFVFIYTILVTIAVILIIINHLAQLQNIAKATEDISNGNLDINLSEEGDIVTARLAKNINNISKGLKLAVENKIKSERMKGELITNVSHDLKTPLTSIINYIHLLKDDKNTEEEKKEYIRILDKKSQRLKALIEDLFEVSKATSGSMELNLEKVEITALLRQTIGELKEKLDESNIIIRTKLPENKIYCNLDGNKTWRVFENLIINITKYSLYGSRAFIEIVERDNKVDIIMKNISAEELNFEVDEIVERFKRGDSSRHTEGSGLGLAISKSIVELQGGEFNIAIDGDLFKVIITFNKIENI
ncbi:sensor histidine kinase [Clostridium tarantellae]|uniref:histidine kinase n=1 Tax=Clostridium tarantellae TaxID=39493 RepID=A0A6I1MK19_9CLOT|nr:HAMP domain-containing sensor histidine kinase [Clostridium tarantellae]MPQ42778.1 hypothetical protein [Clostridium tarantellae]